MKMKKIITVLALVIVLCLALTSCSGSDAAVGYWIVNHAVAGEVVMDEQDAASIGLPAVGTVKLQKSGNCEVVLIGEEHTGTWNYSNDGEITIICEDDFTLTGSIDDEGVMTLTDVQGSEYKLSK